MERERSGKMRKGTRVTTKVHERFYEGIEHLI
jgi:hypothetical protein